MERLKNQLDDIEQCAKEAATSNVVNGAEGEGSEASPKASGTIKSKGVVNPMMEKQRIIIEELRKRFNFQFGDLETLRYVRPLRSLYSNQIEEEVCSGILQARTQGKRAVIFDFQ